MRKEQLDIINAILKNRPRLTKEQRASVGRWEESVKAVTLPVKGFRRFDEIFRNPSYDQVLTFTFADHIETVREASELAEFAPISNKQKLVIIAAKAKYNFFAAEVAEFYARTLHALEKIHHDDAVICCPVSFLDDEIVKMCSACEDVVLFPLDDLDLMSTGKVIWKGAVPEDVTAQLSRIDDVEDAEREKTYIFEALFGYSQRNRYYHDNNDYSMLYHLPLSKFEEMADAVSYGHFQPPSRKETPPSQDCDPRVDWLVGNVVFASYERDPNRKFDYGEFEYLRDAAEVWRHVKNEELDAHVFLSEGEMRRAVDEMTAAGVDSAVDAVYAGVSLEDVLA